MIHGQSELSAVMRHVLATLVYRLDKVLVNAPADFGEFDAGHGVRTPSQILAHVGDVLAWGLGRVTGAPRQEHVPGRWQDEVARLDAVVKSLDQALADWERLDAQVALRLLQGPLCDAMTHVGQLAMLSRMAGCAIAGESFYDAPIAALSSEGDIEA